MCRSSKTQAKSAHIASLIRFNEGSIVLKTIKGYIKVIRHSYDTYQSR